MSVGESAAEREWMSGYNAARALCLSKGVEIAQQQRPDGSAAYESGYDWALWDYEDANGLPHQREQGGWDR